MTEAERRRLRRAVLAAALALTLALPAAGWLLLQDWARARLTDGLLAHAREVQREVRDTLAYAADLGIPLDAESVVHSGFAYFAGVLEGNPQVRFIAVARPPPGADLIFYEGTNRERLGGLLADPAVAEAAASPGGSGGLALPAGNFGILVEPLALPDRPPFAVLHVGIDRRYAEARLAELAGPLAFAVLACAVLAVQAALFAVDGLLAPKLDRLAARLSDTGLVRSPRRRGERRRDEVGAVLRARDAAVDRLQDAYRRMLTYAEEVRQEVFDPAVAERVAALRSGSEADLAPLFDEADAGRDRPPPATMQPATFALAAAVAATGAALAMGGDPGAWAIAASAPALAGLALPAFSARPAALLLPLMLGAAFGACLAGSLAGIAGSAAIAVAATVLTAIGLTGGLAALAAGRRG
jgi:hypothetical protein